MYGHSSGSGVGLCSYAEFDAIDRDGRCRMTDIRDLNKLPVWLAGIIRRFIRL